MATTTRATSLPWEELRHRLDESLPFNNMHDTPYFRDAIYPLFSGAEYARRYAALRAKMREASLDCVIVPGGPNHWSFGGGMQWLTGHWEWHAVANYVVVPLVGEPTLVYSMGGTHLEAVRRETANALGDVRQSRGGRFGEVMVERIRELGLERGRIGLLEIDPRFGDHLPVNQYESLRAGLPDGELVFTAHWMHELVAVHSDEELDCIRMAGRLCQAGMEAIVARARPGVTDHQLRAAAMHAIVDGGGDVNFVILASTPMADPKLIFGNPRPSGRVLQAGDLIVMELAAGYCGYTAQVGSPICVGQPTPRVRRFWDEVAKPGYLTLVEAVGPGRLVLDLHEAGACFRALGKQSRPIHAHGIDFITGEPHIWTDRDDVEPFDRIQRPGNVYVVEPNPIDETGELGMFVGHTFIVTPTGREQVDAFPLELAVAGA
ncbi:MAG TPA: M24 family metallopeptidase [Candidatus Limnocylindria bacterium]|nr:M24 family metallopeptidase [Candidatus Limnocylindria bacterium]